MATTKITSPDLFNLESLNTALKLPSGTTAQRPTSPSTGEWRYNTTTNLVEFWDGGEWRDLQSENIPPINSENFNTVLYTGTGSAQSITGVGFKPDWIWIKDRDTNFSHAVTDSTRGVGNIIKPNSTDAQSTDAQSITSFDTDGFSLGTAGGSFNNNGDNYVAWCWKANAGTTTAGSGTNTTSVTNQANTKAGFSITTFTGSASAAGNFTHGLGEVPDMYIVKTTSFSDSWFVWHKDLANTTDYAIRLNTTAAQQNLSGFWNNTAPTSTLISLGNGILVNNATYVAYAFKSVAGYSKFGTYTGTGATNGPIVNTGFEPAFVMVKTIDGNNGWAILDNKRNPTNRRNLVLFANSDEVEYTASGGGGIDFLSNGFQVNSTEGYLNANGETFIYIAFGSDASAAPALPDSFANKLWTGNGSARDINVGFSPSWTWIKSRSGARNNYLYDILRGPNNQILSNDTGAQANLTGRLTAFNTDGFSLGTDSEVNNNAETYVAWSWKASPVPTINTDGTIQSVVSANQASGFSIVKWDGTGSAATVGHGLSAAPEIILTKRLNGSGDWYSFSTALNSGTNPAYNFIKLNSSDAEALNASSGGSIWNSTSPTATVINVGTTLSGSTSDSYIAYCFTSISGFSKMGSYVGNATSNRAITGLGFAPSWVMIKNISESAKNWAIWDSARGGALTLFPNSNAAEANETGVFVSLDSDGFTVNQEATANGNGSTMIYMAFKANPTPMPLAGNMSFLTIAGGGAAGIFYGAGGGAGGLRTSYGSTSGGGASAESDVTLSAGTYTITVGAGATGGSTTATTVASRKGTDSSIAASSITTITSSGGGGGATGGAGGAAYLTGGNGGSGGGAWTNQGAGTGTASQGFAGGTGTNLGGYSEVNGGGGGASAAGQNASSAAGNGGAGLSVSITGASVGYAGGGGAGGPEAGSGDGTFGTGTDGGGNGGYSTAGQENGTSGTANTGGGGGGGSAGILAGSVGTNGSGGSGVVILRLLTSEYSSSTTGSPTVTTDGTYTILTYTGSGTYVHS